MILVVTLIGGVQMLLLGITGEHAGRIFSGVKSPSPFVIESIDFKETER